MVGKGGGWEDEVAATYAEGAAKKRLFVRKSSKQRLQIINLYSNHVETITKYFVTNLSKHSIRSGHLGLRCWIQRVFIIKENTVLIEQTKIKA